MRSHNGAWAAFDRDNTREMLYHMPFSDFGAMIDPPTEDVTAHVLEMLAALNYAPDDAYVARGLGVFARNAKARRLVVRPLGRQLRLRNVVRHLGARRAERRARHDRARRRLAALQVQNADGGWGETCHSYVDDRSPASAPSTPSQTGLGRQRAADRRAARDTCRAQRVSPSCANASAPDGTWDERSVTGTGFPRDFYINYHLYRHVFRRCIGARRAADSTRFARAEASGQS